MSDAPEPSDPQAAPLARLVLWARRFAALDVGAEDTLSAATDFDAWEQRFMAQRLRPLLLLGFLGIVSFAIGDVLFYSDQLAHLFSIRAVWLGALTLLALAYASSLGRARPELFVAGFLLVMGGGDTHLTIALGGFESDYYAGINLIFIGTAVLVPVRWRLHVLAQTAVVAYYYISHIAAGTGKLFTVAAGENLFFFFWTCLLLDISVALYSRLQRAEYNTRIRLQGALQVSERSRLRNEFYANMNHELRTPLTLILGGFRTLQRANDEATRKTVVQAGLRNAARLLWLINSMLDIARIESGRAELQRRVTDLSALVKSVAVGFESSADRRRISLGGVEAAVLAEVDPTRLRSVLYNLLSNAFKYSDPTGEIAVSLRAEGDAVVLAVSDSGQGINPEQLGELFKRFQRGDAVSAWEDGSGIGLALVKEIIDAHKGRVTVESSPGRGATFTVRLPQGDVSGGAVAPPEEGGFDPAAWLVSGGGVVGGSDPGQETRARPAAADAAMVLVVEDNQDLREYLVRLLSRDYHVVAVPTAELALQRAQELQPDVVLSDMMLPGQTGAELLAALRADPERRDLPVMFLTALTAADARVQALQGGADDYLTKPFIEDELLARLRNLVRARRQQRDAAAMNQQLHATLERQLSMLVRAGQLRDVFPGLQGGAADAPAPSRRRVTLLMIELTGAVALSERLDPVALRARLDEALREASAAVIAWRGAVVFAAGDGLWASFEESAEEPAHAAAQRAASAALELRDRLASLESASTRRGGELLWGLRGALHTGPCIFGEWGAELARATAPVGVNVQLCRALLAAAEPGELLCSQVTWTLLESSVPGRSVGARATAGGRSVEVFRLTSKAKEEPQAAGQGLDPSGGASDPEGAR
ncbi:MAG: response regulator [Deltaproteobacteria bacterium]|nr:response regulator [Deltaproteobacteria bacterium]